MGDFCLYFQPHTHTISPMKHYYFLPLGLSSVLLTTLAVAQTPTVTGLTPRRNAVAAPRTTSVAATFDQALSSNALTLGALKVFSAQAGGLKTGSSAVSGNTLTFTPATGFKPGETIRATLTKAAQSSSGQSLAQAQVFQFTTATAPSTGLFGPGADVNDAGGIVMATGDADNDGDLDLFVVTTTNTVKIRLNTGNGTTFVAGAEVSTGPRPVSIALGDVDSDGDLDFVTGNDSSNDHLTVGLNNGNGTFNATTSNFFSSGLVSIALGDLDGDGDLDLVAGDNEAVGVGVGLNNGQGVFRNNGGIHLPFTLRIIPALGDVDNDGDLDLLVTASGGTSVSIRLNNGSGTFSGSQQVVVGKGPSQVLPGDVDGDGDLDFVTLNIIDNSVSVRLNDGSGTFGGTQEVSIGTGPSNINLGDVDGDGDLDIATNSTNNSVSIRRNNGTGTFGGGQEVALSSGPRDLTLGDLDNDGDLDLATANNASNTVSVHLNQNQALAAPTITSLSATTSSVGSTLVITGTGFLDVQQVTINGVAATGLTVNSLTQLTVTIPAGATTGPVVVTTSSGASNSVLLTIAPPIRVSQVEPTRNAPAAPRNTSVTVTLDQPLTNNAATLGSLKVFSSQAGGQKAGVASVSGNALTFTPSTPFKPGETVYASLSSAAQNSAGVAATPHVFQFTTATTAASGIFGGGANLDLGGTGQNVTIGDMDGDGDLDMVAAVGNNTVSIQLNNGAGSFTAGPTIAVISSVSGSALGGIALGDVDGDGDLDLLAANNAGNTVSVRLNTGTGTFSGGSEVIVDNSPGRPVLGDIDGDGDLDLVTPNYARYTVSVRFNNGSGSFGGGQEITVTDASTEIQLSDIDSDGDLDMLVSFYNNYMIVRLNNGRGVFADPRRITLSGTNYATTMGDVDGDGDLDLATAASSLSTVSIRLNDGAGMFGGEQEIAVNGRSRSIALADVDGDGDLDLVAANMVTNQVSVRYNMGNGSFNGGTEVAVGASPNSLVMGDVDGDGDLDLFTSSFSNTVSVRLNQAGTPGFSLPAATFRLNTGGNALATSLGQYTADQYFSTASSIVTTGSPIAGTTNPALYQTVRNSTSGVLTYNLPVSNGSYTVVLHFADFTFQNVGQRVFNVNLEGVPVLSRYDIVKKVGTRTATTETFPVMVTDGVLNLEFNSLPANGGVNQASIAAIEVLIGSPVLAAKPSLQARELAVYPNPAADRFTLEYTAAKAQAATLRLTDAMGRQVHHQAVSLTARTNQVPVLTMGLSAGIYQLTLVLADGQQLHQRVLVQP